MDEIITTPQTEATSVQPVEAAPVSVEQNDSAFLQKFSALARQEKAIRERAAKLAEREQGVSQFEELKTLASSDPDAFLSKFGLSYGGLTERALKGPQKDDEITQIKNEFSKFKDEITNEARQRRENEEKAALVTVMQDIKSAVADPKEFELVNANGMYEEIWDSMQKYYVENKKWLDPKVIAAEFEKDLRAEADKYLETNYVKSKFGSSTPATEKQAINTSEVSATDKGQSVGASIGRKALMEAVASSSRTLSNNMTPQPSASVTPQAMTPEQLREKAMRAFRETRK